MSQQNLLPKKCGIKSLSYDCESTSQEELLALVDTPECVESGRWYGSLPLPKAPRQPSGLERISRTKDVDLPSLQCGQACSQNAANAPSVRPKKGVMTFGGLRHRSGEKSGRGRRVEDIVGRPQAGIAGAQR